MKIDRKFPAMIYAGCGFSLMLVILVGAVSLYFSERQKQKEYLVEHTYQVLEKVHVIHHHLYEMGMDKQRFRSTGVNIFFQSYNIHSDSLLNELNALMKLVSDNHVQIDNTINLRRRINSLLKFWGSEDVNLKNSAAQSLLGITLMERAKVDTISIEINSISNVERKLLLQREEGSKWLRQRTEFAISAGTLLILVLVCMLIFLILQELKNRINAYNREREMNHLKSNFISLALHEFRTPLSSMLLSISLVEKYTAAHDIDNAIKHSKKIKSTINNMTSILEDFLSLEKLNAGKINPVFQSFDLLELCLEITEEMQHMTLEGQSLTFEHTGEVQKVSLDKNLVRNAIINLIANSIKYAGYDALIKLKTDIKDDLVSISITDNGMGIEEHNQKGLFTPFYRVNHNGSIPGTGLGLSIVLRYVNLMKGKIFFRSTPNIETCFEMLFKTNLKD